MKLGFCATAPLVLLIGSRLIAATTLELTQDSYHVGDRVRAIVNGSENVTVENDITRTSTNVRVRQKTEIDLGTITDDGFYGIRALGVDGTIATAAILVMPKESIVAESSQVEGRLADVPASVVEKLIKGLAADRLKQAAKQALPKWAANNLVGLSTTGTVCIICLVPGGQAACPACATSATGNTLDLGFAVLEECLILMHQAKELNDNEFEALKMLLKARGVVKILRADERFKKILEGLAFAVDVVIEHDETKMIVKATVQEGKKACLLLEVLKRQ